MFPNYKVYNSQSPYFLYYNYNSNNKLVLSNNPRVITKKQSEFSKNIQTNSLNIANNGVFNLKNIVIFNDNKQALKNQFDYFSTKDLSKDVNNFVNKISNDSLLKNNSNNNKILYFNTRQKNDYEYFIYSPKTILKKEVKDFFKKPIDISTRPIIIDSQSFNKPDILNDFIISEENQNIKIDYKKSALNPTKYFLKISDVDITKRFIIQLNQTFSMNWKLKWINQEEFERYQCEQEATYYPITNNSSCNIHD